MTDAAQDSAYVQSILEARARALARVPVVELPGESLSLVVLALGPERYGVEVHFIQEIQPLAGLTAVPGLPAIWPGLVNLRGRLYPVLNLRRHLALPEATSPVSGKIVLVAAAHLNVALLVDDVLEVRQVSRAEIGPPLAEAPDLQQNVRGVTPDLLVILDLETLLADARLVVQEQID